jgi:tRNA (guanine-N7-)-methyltransferase
MHKTILRSFSRRIGKTLSQLQKNLISENLDGLLLNSKNPLENSASFKKINIEIGIGMAEHFMNNAKVNNNELFIGFEPYLNGIANALKISKENSTTNIKLWPDDADIALPNFAKESIDRIYILFPDPWPKKKQQKRRFVCKERLVMLNNMLKLGGKLIFASDIADYFDDVFQLCTSIDLKDISNKDFAPMEGYSKTKYHQKADLEGRVSRFIIFEKNV